MDQALYGTDGIVASLARIGNTLYIAGAFRSVGENNGGLVSYDARTGQALHWLPRVAGTVNAIVPDGTGGWFIGGEFTGVGGVPRSCLAQVRADGSVTDWNPSVTGSVAYVAPPAVSALAVRGNSVFVGGAFGFIGGQPRRDLGSVDARTGVVSDWIEDVPLDGHVSALALQGDTLFVGGGFSSLGGASRSSLAAVNTLTGEVLPWQMDVFGGVNTLLAFSDMLLVGGDFLAVAGHPQSMLVAIDVPGATLLPIDFKVNGISRQYFPSIQVDALAQVNDTLYVVGNFSTIGGQVRSGIAALNPRTGDALTWMPDTTGPRGFDDPPLTCTALAAVGRILYVGGYFNSVGSSYHPYVASWDRTTGGVLDWTPTPNDAVASFAVSGDTLLMGGYFHMVGGWQHRAGLAAIDLATGRVKAWNPNPNGTVCTAVAVEKGRVFVSGDFSTIGGSPQPRSYFAALDTLSGEATSWNPGANSVGTAFLLSGDTLYVSGTFTEVEGQPRNGLASINASSGAVLAWDPNAASYFDGLFPVYAMVRRESTIYLGGTFTEMGGQERRGLAAVNAQTGALTQWNPGTDNSTVRALLVSGNTLYVGGEFGMVGGQARNAIAAIDLATESVSPWYAPPTAWGVPIEVKALALQDSSLYVGGAFAGLNGQPRICLAAVNTSTAAVTTWDPGLDGYVWSLLVSGSTLYAGGGFSRAGAVPADGLAAFALTPAPLPPPAELELAQCLPNPVRTNALIRFGLPTTGTVTLSVFDLQGRRVASLLDHSLLGAGQHSIQLETQGWRPGMYLCRLEVGGRAAARKLVVAR